MVKSIMKVVSCYFKVLFLPLKTTTNIHFWSRTVFWRDYKRFFKQQIFWSTTKVFLNNNFFYSDRLQTFFQNNNFFFSDLEQFLHATSTTTLLAAKLSQFKKDKKNSQDNFFSYQQKKILLMHFPTFLSKENIKTRVLL